MIRILKKELHRKGLSTNFFHKEIEIIDTNQEPQRSWWIMIIRWMFPSRAANIIYHHRLFIMHEQIK